MSKKSFFGLNENIAGLLAYALTWVSGIIVLILERENKFVRFCALQSTVFFGALSVLDFVVSFIPLVGGMLSWLLGIVMVASWIYMMYTAYKGVTFKLPVIGDACWENVNK